MVAEPPVRLDLVQKFDVYNLLVQKSTVSSLKILEYAVARIRR